MIKRPRRLRRSSIIREMVAETRLHTDMFIQPYFIINGTNKQEKINAMPGISRLSADLLLKEIESNLKAGLNKILLFGVGDHKTNDGKSAYDETSIIPFAIKKIKQNFGEDLLIITDICLCAYTTHGHCGIVKNNYVQNDLTLEVLKKMAVTHAEAGADIVSPSDMMDGRIAAIRKALDDNKFNEVSIMSYAVKFASAYYGPFREAADSSPSKGDRKTYQMDYRNINEALKEAKLDEEEGADILMIKPALAYLDVITIVKEQTKLPVACYNVSAEYSMIKNAASSGMINERDIVMENMYAFARAGANIIISYHSTDILKNNWI